MSALDPIYLQQRTFPDPVGTSYMGQFRTSHLRNGLSVVDPADLWPLRSARAHQSLIHLSGVAKRSRAHGRHGSAVDLLGAAAP